MDGLQFAALYTLQDGLAGDAELLCGLDHGDEARRGVLDEAAEQIVGDADFPRRPRRGLFGRNETIFDPAQHSAGCQVEHFGRLRTVTGSSLGVSDGAVRQGMPR